MKAGGGGNPASPACSPLGGLNEGSAGLCILGPGLNSEGARSAEMREERAAAHPHAGPLEDPAQATNLRAAQCWPM